MLEKLAVERERLWRRKNLVGATTRTGKTYLAALAACPPLIFDGPGTGNLLHTGCARRRP